GAFCLRARFGLPLLFEQQPAQCRIVGRVGGHVGLHDGARALGANLRWPRRPLWAGLFRGHGELTAGRAATGQLASAAAVRLRDALGARTGPLARTVVAVTLRNAAAAA